MPIVKRGVVTTAAARMAVASQAEAAISKPRTVIGIATAAFGSPATIAATRKVMAGAADAANKLSRSHKQLRRNHEPLRRGHKHAQRDHKQTRRRSRKRARKS